MKHILLLFVAISVTEGVLLAFTLHNQNEIRRSVQQCAKGSGWITDNDCKAMCTGRVK